MLKSKLSNYLHAQINLRTKNKRKHRKHPLFETQDPKESKCLLCGHKIIVKGLLHWASHEMDCLHFKGGEIELPPHWFKTTNPKCACHDAPLMDCAYRGKENEKKT